MTRFRSNEHNVGRAVISTVSDITECQDMRHLDNRSQIKPMKSKTQYAEPGYLHPTTPYHLTDGPLVTRLMVEATATRPESIPK